MSGFPIRPSRDTYGPTLRDIYAAENPETDIPAAAFNTLFWQTSGLGVAHPVRAVAVAEWSGSAMVVSYQGEAWNPNNDVAHPVIARTATGVYTVTFLSEYDDETGSPVSTVLNYASAKPLGAVTAWGDLRIARAWIDAANPLQVNVTTWNLVTGVAADVKFLLEVA